MEAAMDGGKRNRWMTHVRKTMKAHKGKTLSQVLKMAKKTYKKGGAALSPMPVATETGPVKGGAALSPQPLSGGRRRKTRRGSRRH